MTLGQALGYFLREASVNLVRSWKVSSVAVLTIAVSLFVGGAFLLLSNNLAALVHEWQSETKVTVYLAKDVPAERLDELATEVSREPWVRGTARISQDEAVGRFRELFPSLADLVGGSEGEPLPASLEIAIDPAPAHPEAVAEWLRALQAKPEVEMVDDDREWLGQLATLVALGRGLGMALGLILLAAAVFTIASVVRLTAYLYHDEIAIMRLVGATEFFIRGPFYAEGLIQGLVGGALAALGLLGSFQLLAPRAAASAWGALVLHRFLSLPELGILVLVGASAGLGGAILSLRKERLGEVE